MQLRHAAWGAIFGYEVFAARRQQLLSEAMDDWIDAHPVLTRAAIFYTALHLANWLPARADVYYLAAKPFLRKAVEAGVVGARELNPTD